MLVLGWVLGMGMGHRREGAGRVASTLDMGRRLRERDLVRRLKGGSHGTNRTAALTTEVLDIPLRGAV